MQARPQGQCVDLQRDSVNYSLIYYSITISSKLVKRLFYFFVGVDIRRQQSRDCSDERQAQHDYSDDFA